jgi:hypothetical protein
MLTESNEGEVPMADHDLRDTFSPEMLLADDDAPRAPATTSRPPSQAGAPVVADAAGLFDDAPRAARPKVSAADAKKKPRRCPSCGGVVPAGMSLCRCGLDLDTGQRAVMDEVLDGMTMSAPRRASTPLYIAIPGGVMLAVFGVLTVAALILSSQTVTKTEDGWLSPRNGYLLLAAVGAFGIYAAIQFLRGLALKPLVVALLLGAIVNVVALIVLPIVDPLAVDRRSGTAAVGLDDESLPTITNVTENIDTRLIYYGIAILLADAGLILFLISPTVRSHFERAKLTSPVPLL